MRKLGILTFWNVPNYGAFMQAYALQKVLDKRYRDFVVKQIPHLNRRHFDMYYSNSIKNRFSNWFINPHFYIELLKSKSKNCEVESIKKFLDYYRLIPNFENYYQKGINNIELDTLVLGSDIIWDYTVPFFGKDAYLFGCGINAKHKISYAPGCGSVKDGFFVPDYVVKGLRELEAISVRDENSAKIVKKITKKDVTIVLDPTLLWDFLNDPNIIKPKEDNYIIVYGSFFTDKMIKEAKEYSRSKNMKLICLSSLDDTFEWCDQVISLDRMTPFEWVGYFKYAKVVMTCTYHGLLFSLIFKKRIVFNMSEFIWNKSQSFINELELKEVLMDSYSFEEKVNWDWNYHNIDSRLKKMKERSYAFLDGAIYGK